jgi:phospholipid/cholesterol/gamma-HCH transport system permease protein
MKAIDITLTPISAIGRFVLFIIEELGRLAIFFFHGLILIFRYPFQTVKILEQIHIIGAKSVFVIALTGGFTGMVLGLQGYYTLVQFGSEGMLGAAVGLTLVRELGPVFAAIMITARAGSAMAAEVGIMRISEQIDALETMGINPVRFLFSPRLAAALISFPLLTSIFDVVGIFGGFLTGSVLLGINSGIYFSHMTSSIVMADITGGYIKSIAFGALITTICCYQGYYTHTRRDGFGAKGVGQATTSAVVFSSVTVLVIDYVITSFLL